MQYAANQADSLVRETDMSEDFVFDGNPRVKEVQHLGVTRQLIVWPRLAVRGETMGIAVCLFEPDKPKDCVDTWFWGLTEPNLIALWRGLRILEEVTRLQESDIKFAYSAALRHPDDHQKIERIVVIKEIGRDTHKSIMDSAIPARLVPLIQAEYAA